VKHMNPFLPQVQGTDWQLLGELELPVGSNLDPKLSAWLTEVLNPLDLHTDFFSKVLKSAGEAIARAAQTELVTKFEHLHLLIFVPSERPSKGGTWGFFGIEKAYGGLEGESSPGHRIQFYLYLAG
jgi:hypothetical protein